MASPYLKSEMYSVKILAPLTLWLRQIGVGLVNNVFKPLVFYFQSLGVELARDLTNIGILKDAIFSLDFSKVNEKWDAANKLAEEQKTQLAGKLDSGKLGLQPLGDGDKKAAADTTEAGAEMAKAVKQAAKDRKDSVNEQIKDAEKLRDALNDERLVKLQAILKDLEAGKTVKIDADTKTARTEIEQVQAMWDAIQDKTVTLTVNQAGAAAAGTIPGHATGTILPGYGGGDRRLILAEDGEAITRKEAVAYYGRSFMAALNARQIPRFAEGGIVSDIASAGVSAGGSGLHPVTLNMPGAGAFQMAAAPDVVRELQAAIAREALKYGSRR